MTQWPAPATTPWPQTGPRKPDPIQRRGTMDERTSRSPTPKKSSFEELRKPHWPMVPFAKLYADPSRNGIYKSKQHHGTGVRIVNMGDLFAHDVINSRNTDMKRVQMTESEMIISGLADNDLLFGRRSLVESGAGKCSLVGKLTEPTTFESSIIRVRVNQSLIRSRFIFYWLKSRSGRGRMQAIVTGTNVKGIRASVLKTLQVPRPPLRIQDTIVSILRTYDDLIENNRRRIRLLEQAARILYDEWFVRLRFPGHEGMTVTNGVPEGWRRTTIGEMAPFNYGKGLRQADRVQGQYPVFGSSGVVGTHEAPLVAGPGIVVGRKGNVGSVFWTDNDFYPIDTCYYVDKAHSTAYIYHALLRTRFINTDVAVPGLNRDFAHSRALLMPDGRMLALFEERALMFLNQISKLSRQNAVLTEARDLLLPRLMTSEISA